MFQKKIILGSLKLTRGGGGGAVLEGGGQSLDLQLSHFIYLRT